MIVRVSEGHLDDRTMGVKMTTMMLDGEKPYDYHHRVRSTKAHLLPLQIMTCRSMCRTEEHSPLLDEERPSSRPVLTLQARHKSTKVQKRSQQRLRQPRLQKRRLDHDHVQVCGPTMPSGSSPHFRWKCVTATYVSRL